MAKIALYSGVGATLTHYIPDVERATLREGAPTPLPGSVQYVWPHPSRRFLYVSSSSGGPGMVGNSHHLAAFRIETSGRLEPHGEPAALRWRPVHHCIDRSGRFALVAYNEPSGLSVHQINPDGTIGHEIRQPNALDVGVYAHQIMTTPSNKTVILVTRGYPPTEFRSEVRGAIKIFGFEEGILTNKSSIAPSDGSSFGPRHLDFHPTQPWVYVTLERQSKLHVYALQPDGDLSPQPLFVKDTLLRSSAKPSSSAGPIHVHPNGTHVYLSNRGGWASTPPRGAEFIDGMRLLTSTDSSIVVYSIDNATGEPTMIQTVDSYGAHPRTFSLDPSARLLIAGTLVPVALREADAIRILPAGLALFRISAQGALEFVRKYDLDIGDRTQWWTGLVAIS